MGQFDRVAIPMPITPTVCDSEVTAAVPTLNVAYFPSGIPNKLYAVDMWRRLLDERYRWLKEAMRPDRLVISLKDLETLTAIVGTEVLLSGKVIDCEIVIVPGLTFEPPHLATSNLSMAIHASQKKVAS